jgi:quaternary ammonium compound-resistance protein SugE
VAWLILVGAGLLEIVWATALKDAEGFTRLWPSVIGIAFSLVSFVMLAVALKTCRWAPPTRSGSGSG